MIWILFSLNKSNFQIMNNNFKIKAIPAELFEPYFTWPKQKLRELDMELCVVEKSPGFPCRVSLEDAQVGEEVLLINYQHHKADSAYQSNGPIFVRRNAAESEMAPNQIPPILQDRNLSIRGYNQQGKMVDAIVVHGSGVKQALHKLFDDGNIDYLHIHNAGPGCFNCEVQRYDEQSC